MEIQKQTITTVKTTDNKRFNVGDTMVFNADGKCFTGIYLGVSKRGALMFKGLIKNSEVTFNIMPRSVKEIYLADLKVNESEDMKND